MLAAHSWFEDSLEHKEYFQRAENIDALVMPKDLIYTIIIWRFLAQKEYF